MYDLNGPSELQASATAPETAAYVDPAVEFRARIQAITPEIFVARILIAMNVVLFLAMVASGVPVMSPTAPNLIQWGADFGPRTIGGGEWWRIFTSMFLHIGIIHIAFNMFVLWQIGPFVERLLGNIGFSIVYMVSGIAGAFVSLAWNPYLVSAGASGAIFGLYGALLGFLLMRRDSIPSEVLEPLTKNALIFIGYNAVYGFIRSGTDVAAHVGGLAAGFLCGLCMSVPLTIDPLPRRGLRNAAVALGALALFIGTAAKLPRPIDFQAEMQTFGAVEKSTLATYNAAVKRAQLEHLRDEQLADLIEKSMPDWVREHDRLAALKGLPAPMQRVVSQLLQYMEARRQSWTMMAQALRKRDIDGVRKAMQRQREAEQLARQVGQANH
jgi:rhomboid protease GluP